MELINIDCKEIIQWLESRRKLGGGWPETYKGYQLKLKQLLDYIKTLGYEDITEFIEKKESDFSYLNLTELFEMLEDTEEAKKRTFFNSYAARSLKDSKGLIKILERGNLHLVDIGKKINHALSFEKVALTKTIKNNEKATNESLNRIRMNKAAVTRNEKEKVEYLKKFDLDEKNLHTKISELVYKLPEKIGEIVKKLQKDKLRGYLDFFYEFSLCMNPSLKDDDLRCKFVEYLKNHGDVASRDFVSSNEKPGKFDYKGFFQKKGYYDLSGNLDNTTEKAQGDTGVNWDMQIEESGGDTGIQWEISEVNDNGFEIIDETDALSTGDDASILTSKELRVEVLAELNQVQKANNSFD